MAARYKPLKESRPASGPASLSSSSDMAANPSSRHGAIVQSKSVSSRPKPNLTTMVKKLIDKNTTARPKNGVYVPGYKTASLPIPSDALNDNIKSKGLGFTGLQKKLFGDGKKQKVTKALSEIKDFDSGANTRSLAMVLRSERELLSANKELEADVASLKALLEAKNLEVEKLKDLCLKQRQEIKELKSAVLFPEDDTNYRLQGMLTNQGKELLEAKRLVPLLQRQVTSLTDQLQNLADDLAEVKADKFGKARQSNSPKTPKYDHEFVSSSLEFSSCNPASSGSPEDMFLQDLNPCLTPYSVKTRSKDSELLGYTSPIHHGNNKSLRETNCILQSRKVSKSTDCNEEITIDNRIKDTKARKSLHHRRG